MVNVSTEITGLTELGTDLGGFLTAIAPAIGLFVLLIGIFGGIVSIILAIVFVIKKKVGGQS